MTPRMNRGYRQSRAVSPEGTSFAVGRRLALGLFLLSLPLYQVAASDIPYADVDQTAFSPNYPQATQFLANPIAAHASITALVQNGEVTLPPLPDALKPLGPAKVPASVRQDSIMAELPSVTGKGGTNNDMPPVTRHATADDRTDTEETVMQTPAPHSASNAFLDWVRAHRDAEDLAKQQRSQYNPDGTPATAPGQPTSAKPKDSGAADGDDGDLLLNIRYPYLWNQDAPTSRSSSSVIYTVPKR